MSPYRYRSPLAAIAAVAFGLAAGVPTAAAHDDNARFGAASDKQAAQDQSSTSAPASSNDTTTAPDPNAKADSGKPKMRHPPTAQMDQATPTQKSPSDKMSAKHPPTSAMDKATPDEKSPKSAQ